MQQETLPNLSAAARSLIIGGVYEHYKGHRYKVLEIARHSETLEEMVIYQALYGEGLTWARPLSMFLETITINNQSQPRFSLCEKRLQPTVPVS